MAKKYLEKELEDALYKIISASESIDSDYDSSYSASEEDSYSDSDGTSGTLSDKEPIQESTVSLPPNALGAVDKDFDKIMETIGSTVLLLMCLLGACYFYFKQKFSYWKNRGIPHRKITIPFGNLLELVFFNDAPANYFLNLYNEFEGPYIGFYAMTKPCLLIRNPELIKTFLIKEFTAFSDRCFFSDRKIDPIISNALIGVKNPRWKELRRKLSPVFTSGKIKMMTPLMVDCGKNLKTYLSDKLNQNIEMKEVAAKFTTDVIASCAFGIDGDCYEKDSKFCYYGKLLFPTTALQELKTASYVFAPIFVKMFKFGFVDEKASKFFRKIFMETLKSREISKIKRNDLVDILNEIKKEENSDDTFKFDDDIIFAQALSFFAAGYDTTSSIIAFTLHELSIHPEMQQKLRNEVFRKIEEFGGITYTAIQNMSYLHMVVCETLRKYPLTPLLNREAVQDYKLPETGLVIEKGVAILISQKALHWDPHYFPNPEKYDPERFNEDNKHNIPNFVYLPFGDGPRNCIAERFGLLSSKLGVVHVIKNFVVEKNSKTLEPIVFGRSPVLQSKYGAPTDYFAALYKEFDSPYIGFYAMTNPYLLVKDPELIKTILIKEFNSFSNRCFFNNKKIDRFMSNALFGIKNPQWKELRRKLSPVFTSGKIKMMTPLMVNCGKNLEKYLSKKLNQDIEVKEVAAKYTTDVISSCAFGLDGNCFEEDSDFCKKGTLIFPTTTYRALKTMTYVFAHIFVKIFRYGFVGKEPYDYFRKIFMDTLKSRQLNKDKRNDLVDILNEIRNEENSDDPLKFNDDVIFAQALIFFAAGHETTSSTIAFTLHELSVNPKIQQRLREEIFKKIEEYGGLTYEAIQNMTYLDMIVSETLRKYPLTLLINRKTVQDYKYPETGLVIEKGIAILISQKALHWDPKFFPNPEKYDPERFNKENKQSIPNYVYLPFGDGPRNCIGERFALTMETCLNCIWLFMCLFGAFYIYCKRKLNYWHERGVPHRNPTVPFGHFLELFFFKGAPADYFAEVYKEFNSPYIGFYAMTNPYLIIKDPELIKTILIKEFDSFSDRCFFNDRKIDLFMSNALLGIKNPQWKELRKKLSPVFTSGKIRMMTSLMIKCAENLEKYLSKKLNEDIEIKEIAGKYTTDVISSCAFGLDGNCFEENSDFCKNGKLVFPTTRYQALKTMTYVFAHIFVKIFRYGFVGKEPYDYFRKIFMDTLKSRHLSKDKRNDLVDILNEIRNEENSDDLFKFDDDVIFAQALIFFSAGHETTSSTIAFTLHELSVNPKIQQRLREEIFKKIEEYGGITYEAIQNMTYLDMIISETLRKYPITFLIHRKTVQDYKYPETGLVIEKGIAILISQRALHWDPKYFPNPEKYDPERFNKENKPKIPNYVYLPFGDGPRNCIGERFGFVRIKTLLETCKYFEKVVSVLFKYLRIMETLLNGIFLFICLFSAFYIYCKRKFNYWQERDVPHRKTIVPFGHFLEMAFFKGAPSDYFAKLYNDFNSPYIGVYAMTNPYLLVKDPELIKTILIKEFNAFSNRCFYNNKKIDLFLSNALLGVKNPEWRKLRKKLSPVFTSGKIKMMTPLMVKCEIAAKYTTDVVSSCAFGLDGNCFEEDSDFCNNGKLIFPTTTYRALKSMTYVFAHIFVKIFRYRFVDKKPYDFFRKIFMDTLKSRRLSQVKRNDLVDILNEIRNEEDSEDSLKFDDDVIFAQALIFFAAGHETTSSTIALTLHELSVNPKIQERLRKEIFKRIEEYGGITYEAIQNMTYLDMVISETLRKYPLTPLIVRETVQDYKYPETGLVIEKGVAILISQKALHWDPNFFPNPDKYDPERFNEENRNKIPNYVYLPFGDGPRNCIGERFALVSSKLGIIHVIKNYIVSKNSKTKEPIVFGRLPLLQSKHVHQLINRKSYVMGTLENGILILICLFGAFYIYCKRKFNYWKERGVPHREITVPFGNLLELVFFKDAPTNFFAKLYNDFKAPYIGFYALTSPYLLVKDPDLIKTILIKEFNVFPNRCFFSDKKIDPFVSNALLGLQGSEWKELRRKLVPLFTSGKIKMMTPLMEVSAKYTTDVITSCAFGIDGNCFEKDNDFCKYGKLLFPTTRFRALKSMTYVFAPIFVKIFKYTFVDEKATTFFRKVFMDTLKLRQQSKVKRNDLVDILNEIKNEENINDTFRFDDDIIFAQALMFFAAGHETTSSTIAFTLHELCVNPDIQQKLREEIFQKIEEYDGLTYEAVQNMTYLQMVVSETLRKYPLTPLLNRRTEQDYKFSETGLVIEKGTAILISQKALHWDPQYFPNPEKFDPERFNSENKQNIPNYVYLPFGDGPRNCIGERFGLLSSKLGIIHVIKNFTVEKNSKTREPIVFGRSPLLQSKYGINLTCTKL
ncbi:hypothetical protein RN001_012401 [Aquatica leii]|uniref:Cytochrome P450 n=1 Tax=Aquatica leii TaxID=1421715 RepID=A0AAN7P2Z9_9COLE|nr:hypothetical protein RN001_012401 [Aquatica leii]